MEMGGRHVVSVSFYKGLLGHSDPAVQRYPDSLFLELVKMKLTDEDHEVLKTQITREEIKKVFKSMGKDKAPGLYGYKTEFFTADWDILGTYVENTVLEFLSTWSMPRQVNSTILALIPKIPNVEQMKGFRPISCCNVVYKGISKLISNRLSRVLHKVIGTSQSDFVKGRSISDKILLATELVKDYHKMSITPRCALMIDLKRPSTR